MAEPVVWVYQLSSSEWDQESYRLSVSEGEHVAWPIGKKQTAREPAPGERIVCWWAKTGAREFGVVGWGAHRRRVLRRRNPLAPEPPSDRWSMSPLSSPDLEAAIDAIRGRMRQATLFAGEGDKALNLLAAIRDADR